MKYSAFFFCCFVVMSVVANSQEWQLEEVRHNGFGVELRANQQAFVKGEELVVTYRGAKDAFVHVFDVDPEGQVTLLFPNEHCTSNFVRAHQQLKVPDPQSDFVLPAGPPYGDETIVVLATRRKLDLREETAHQRFQQFVAAMRNHGKAETYAAALMKGFIVASVSDTPPTDWACEYITVKTTANKNDVREVQPEGPTPSAQAAHLQKVLREYEKEPRDSKRWAVGANADMAIELATLGFAMVTDVDTVDLMIVKLPLNTSPRDVVTIFLSEEITDELLTMSLDLLPFRKVILVTPRPLPTTVTDRDNVVVLSSV